MIAKHQYLSKDDPQSVKSQSLPLHLSFFLEYAHINRFVLNLKFLFFERFKTTSVLHKNPDIWFLHSRRPRFCLCAPRGTRSELSVSLSSTSGTPWYWSKRGKPPRERRLRSASRPRWRCRPCCRVLSRRTLSLSVLPRESILSFPQSSGLREGTSPDPTRDRRIW